MKLGRLAERQDNRDVVGGAGAAALLGLGTLISGLLMWRLSHAPGGAATTAVGVVPLALALGIYRRSRVCAVIVLTLFVLERLAVFLFLGIGGVGILWTVVIGSALYGGLKAILAERARTKPVAAAG
jgi:hypothetical protein